MSNHNYDDPKTSGSSSSKDTSATFFVSQNLHNGTQKDLAQTLLGALLFRDDHLQKCAA